MARTIHEHKTRSLTNSRDLGVAAKEDEALSKLERKYKDFLPAADKQAAERAINSKNAPDRNVALLAGLAFQVLNLVKSKPDIGNTKTQSEILALVEEVAKDIESLKQDQKAKGGKVGVKKKCSALNPDGCDEESDAVDDSPEAKPAAKPEQSPENQIAQGVKDLTDTLAKLSKTAEAASKAAAEEKVKRDKEAETLKKNLDVIIALQKAIVEPSKPTEPVKPGEPEIVKPRTTTTRTPVRDVDRDVSDEPLEKK